MPMPFVYAVGTVASGVGVVNPGIPAGTVADDVLVLFVENEDALGPAAPAGWALIVAQFCNSGSLSRLSVYWKRAATGEAAPTVPDPGDHVVARIVGLRGCTTVGAPTNVVSNTNELTSDTSVSIPGATTKVPNCLILAAFSTGTDVASTAHATGWTNATLANLTERVDNWVIDGLGGGFAVVSGEKALPGAYAATTATCTTAQFKALVSIAFQAAQDYAGPYTRPAPGRISPTGQWRPAPLESPPAVLVPAFGDADASTPPFVKANDVSKAVTTASFTPPVGALLVAFAWHDTAGGNVTNTSLVTDTQGLTWTVQATVSKESDGAGFANGHIQVSTAVVGSSVPMTVTTTGTNTGDPAGLYVRVVTGANTSSPMDATPVENTSTNSAISVNITTANDGARVFLQAIDWNVAAAMTAGANQTAIVSDFIGATDDRIYLGVQNAVTSPAGSVTMSTATPVTGNTNNYVAVALRPAGGATTHNADATLTATATITAAATSDKPADATLTAAAGITTTAASSKPVDAALTGAGTITAGAATTKPVAATLTGTATVTPTATATKPVDAALTATTTITATAAGTKPVAAAVNAVAAVTATATGTKPVDAALSVTATITADAEVVAGAVTIDAAPTFTATITPTAVSTKPVDATLTGTAAVTGTATTTKPVTAALTVTAAASGSAVSTKPVDATRTTTATITGAGTSTKPVAATLTATATITADAVVGAAPVTIDAAPTFTATITPTAASAKPVAATLTGTAAVTAAAAGTKPVESTLTATASITTGVVSVRPAMSTLALTATITAAATVTPLVGPITFRPDTGITPRGSSGTTSRPGSGTTPKPSGITVRPFTGVTQQP